MKRYQKNYRKLQALNQQSSVQSNGIWLSIQKFSAVYAGVH